MPCWILLSAIVLYFVLIDRRLRAMQRDFDLLTGQLKQWGFIKPESEK